MENSDQPFAETILGTPCIYASDEEEYYSEYYTLEELTSDIGTRSQIAALCKKLLTEDRVLDEYSYTELLVHDRGIFQLQCVAFDNKTELLIRAGDMDEIVGGNRSGHEGPFILRGAAQQSSAEGETAPAPE